MKNPPHTDMSCRTFVQQFYDWYSPIARKEGGSESSWEHALRVKGKMFSLELPRKLKEEDAIQAKVHDAGLDADPFLNSQDPAQRYVVGTVRREGDRCWADVYGIYSGHKSAKADVVPELALINHQWVFVNFLYGNSNLLDLLNTLRKRQSAPPRTDGIIQPVRPKHSRRELTIPGRLQRSSEYVLILPEPRVPDPWRAGRKRRSLACPHV